MLRRVVVGSGALSLIPVLKAATPIKDEAAAPKKPAPIRPSDLPIYESPYVEYFESQNLQKETKMKESYIKSALLGPVSALREQTQNVLSQTTAISDSVKENYNEFRTKSQWIVKYLREEDNKNQRYGAVVMGGLSGYILGLRGGIFRRIFYLGIGTTAMGFICFPEESAKLYQDNKVVARQYINIAYNFLYGVKPGDPQLEVHFPELTIPKDLSEFTDLVTSVASSIKQAVMPPPSKDEVESKPTDKKN